MGRAISGFASNYRRGAFVVGASVDPTDEAEADTDRYLRALAVLFERVYALLRGSGEHVVWVIPATRDVRAINGWARFHLRPKDVGDRIAEAERFPLGAPKSGERDRQVRLVAGMPRAYDGHAHGGIVLADFVANSLRLPSAQARFWSEIVEVGADAFGLSLERAAGLLAAAGPLPCIAADGAARVAVAAVMADASAKPVLPTSPGWARDQAARWVVAGRRRAGALA